MKAAFLVRCSTDQGDYARQIDDLTKVANEFGFVFSEKHIFGEYVTGRDDTTIKDRKSIENIRKSAENKDFDVILVNEVSRMSRDSVSGRVYIRQFNNLGVPVYFRDRRKWTIDIHTKEVDSSFEKELGSYFDGAAEYLKSLKTQTASGRRKRLADNQMIQGKPAFGYKKKGGSNKYDRNTIIINEKTMPIVLDTYNQYLEDSATLKSTSLAITNKYGKRFPVGKINHILNYTGYHTGNTTVTTTDPDDKSVETFVLTFDPVIDEETYNKVQIKLKDNRASKVPFNTTQKVHLLSRLIKCSFCEHSFTPRRRADKRTAHAWICMSRINNSADCESTINLNDEKITDIIWKLIKTELLIYSDINIEEKTSRITDENNKISNFEDEKNDLIRNIEDQKKIQNRAYDAFISAPDGLLEVAKERYNNTLVETQKEIDYSNNRISLLNQNIEDCRYRITRYNQTDFTESYISDIENDFNKKRNLFLEYIKAVYPYKVDYRIVVLEVHTIDGIFNILLNANMRNNKTAYYIDYSFAKWQNSKNKIDAYKTGNYFAVTNPSMIMDSNELEEFLTFEEMIKVCTLNDWIIKY